MKKSHHSVKITKEEEMIFEKNQILRLLLEKGANPKVKNSERKTPAQIAKMNGFAELAEILKRAARETRK